MTAKTRTVLQLTMEFSNSPKTGRGIVYVSNACIGIFGITHLSAALKHTASANIGISTYPYQRYELCHDWLLDGPVDSDIPLY